jgi:hypothetical protein
MSKVCRNIVVLLILVLVARSGWATPSDELSEMLARAEALYYEADFAKSVEVLLRADEMLRQQPAHLEEKTNVKLQLALGYIGLNDSARAKSYLGELFALDSDRVIDPKMFSPKVIKLADEARAEQVEVKCRSLSAEAESDLRAANGDALVQLIGSSKTKCANLTTFYPRAADLVFKEGVEIYKKAQMPDALKKFRAALVLDPKHELAAQYAELAESKLELNAERALLLWRKDFTAGEFASAARDYRELSTKSIDEARGEYRSALSDLVDSWNRACAGNDKAAMESIRVQINALLPEPSFGEDILAKLKTCAPVTGCIQMDTQTAMARLKRRVDPQFSTNMKAQVKMYPVRILVKARINEKGEIASSDLVGGHPALYSGILAALGRWQFSPLVTAGGPQCVDTEIPFVINLNN